MMSMDLRQIVLLSKFASRLFQMAYLSPTGLKHPKFRRRQNYVAWRSKEQLIESSVTTLAKKFRIFVKNHLGPWLTVNFCWPNCYSRFIDLNAFYPNWPECRLTWNKNKMYFSSISHSVNMPFGQSRNLFYYIWTKCISKHSKIWWKKPYSQFDRSIHI